MQTRESIVQRLFSEGLITAEEAVVLLKTEVTKWLPSPNQIQPWIGPGPGTVPYPPYYPNQPIQPINLPYCDWHTGTGNPNPVSFTTTYTSPGINKNSTDK